VWCNHHQKKLGPNQLIIYEAFEDINIKRGFRTLLVISCIKNRRIGLTFQSTGGQRCSIFEENFIILAQSFTSRVGKLPLRLKTISSVLVSLKDRPIFLFQQFNATKLFSEQEKERLKYKILSA